MFQILLVSNQQAYLTPQAILTWQVFRRAPFFSANGSDLYNQNQSYYIHMVDSPSFPTQKAYSHCGTNSRVDTSSKIYV